MNPPSCPLSSGHSLTFSTWADRCCCHVPVAIAAAVAVSAVVDDDDDDDDDEGEEEEEGEGDDDDDYSDNNYYSKCNTQYKPQYIYIYYINSKPCIITIQ